MSPPRGARLRTLAAVLLALGTVAAARAADPGGASAAVVRSGEVVLVRIDGSINPASSDFLARAIQHAEQVDAAALLIELDTPGGLVASTKDIIQAMLGSKVPIVVYVAPQGAWAGSAGTFITLAAHVAAMAPGSSIGAAHPVGIGGGGGGGRGGAEGEAPAEDHASKKAENMLSAFIESIAARRDRNVEWAGKAVRESVAVTADEALELGVIDLVAESRADLLARLGEHEFEHGGERVRLEVAGAPVDEFAMSVFTRVMNVIADPNVAVLLLMAGLLGLYIEFNQPGMVLPGAVGAACLLLALIAMQILPFSWLGVLLVIAGAGLFAAEAFVGAYGILMAVGVASLLLGGSLLFDRPEVSDLNVSFWEVLVPAVGGMALFGGLVVFAVGRSLRLRQQSGTHEMVGMHGVATTDLTPEGTVFIRGEYWTAEADETIPAQSRVTAVEVVGLRLRVRRTDG